MRPITRMAPALALALLVACGGKQTQPTTAGQPGAEKGAAGDEVDGLNVSAAVPGAAAPRKADSSTVSGIDRVRAPLTRFHLQAARAACLPV